MTHDELTLRIIKLSEDDKKDWKIYPALRAVVELHRPIWRGCNEDNCCGSTDMCRLCADEYPCDTIQAIEKELQ